jgi:4-hydroxy-3-polyprenylbenzoate decarboxylase
MLKLSRLGIWIIPPVLTFYHKPKNIEDIVDFIVGKVLEALGIEHDLYKKWGEK